MDIESTVPAAGATKLTDCRPEDDEFWNSRGKRVAIRNLWISIPNLLCAFSVWLSIRDDARVAESFGCLRQPHGEAIDILMPPVMLPAVGW